MTVSGWAGTPELLHHDVEVTLQVDQGAIAVVDKIRGSDTTLPQQLEIALNAGFSITDSTAKSLTTLGTDSNQRQHYRLELRSGAQELVIRYQGVPRLPMAQRPSGMPIAVIDKEGVYLDGASAWYPQFDHYHFTAELRIHHQPDWISISQGERLETATKSSTAWRVAQPQDELYLLAGPYRLYTKAGRHAEAQVYLRASEPELAQRYLEITDRYLDLYSRLIGQYPYAKFAAVENRWETGYGMPSFTLLGPRVMRLPFILTSSYPHEILHNWWGNSVYPDYASGNWAEGLTSYLADHLLQEQLGQGASYRRAALQKYADYVGQGRDFPLQKFRSRHDGASQAVGYGKTLMLFHMLRQEIGDSAFVAGLRTIYQRYRYRTAGFDALASVFSEVSGKPLKEFFAQWVERTGAPSLVLDQVNVEPVDSQGYRLSLRLRQTQSDTAYRLRIPVAVTLQGRIDAVETVLSLNGAGEMYSMTFQERPLRIDVDPRFELFRRLDPAELPAAVGQLFGATRLTVVIPSDVKKDEAVAYQQLVAQWRQRFTRMQVINDLQSLPEEGGVWLLGQNNRHREMMLGLLPESQVTEHGDIVQRARNAAEPNAQSLVLTARRTNSSTLAWLLPESPGAVPALARKLPHYGKYSFLLFEGSEAHNVLKGEWSATGSPLTVQLGRTAVPMGALYARKPLIE